VPLRVDFTAVDLRCRARQSHDAAQARRLLALAAIYDGGSRSEAARIGGVTLQIVRDWVLRFNTGGPDGLIDRKAPGPTPRLSAEQRQALEQAVQDGPNAAVHDVVRWRLIDLVQWVWEQFRVAISVQTLSRELRAMGYRKLSARPRHHAQAEGAIADFKKRMARPVRKPFCRSDTSSLHQRIRPVDVNPAKMEIRASRSS
jgi:transposase